MTYTLDLLLASYIGGGAWTLIVFVWFAIARGTVWRSPLWWAFSVIVTAILWPLFLVQFYRDERRRRST